MPAAQTVCWFRNLLWQSLPLLALCAINFPAIAQTDIRFQRITVDDGLSQSAITAMVQDELGYLWIGTRDGLNRYDGNTFTIYRNDGHANSLPSQNISNLFLDRHHRLWVAYKNGISLYNPYHNNFRNFKPQTQSDKDWFIRDFDQTSDSTILLSTNQGLFSFNTRSGLITDNTDFDFLPPHTSVASLVVEDENTWLATDSCLWRKRAGQTEWLQFFQPGERLKAAYFEKSRELYVRTQNKLWKLDRGKDTIAAITNIIPNQWPLSESVFKTGNNQLWVAHGEISVFDSKDQFQSRLGYASNEPFSLSGAFVSCIYETKDGVIWVGTNGIGLNKYDPYRSVFGYIGHFPGSSITLADSYINSVYTNNDLQIIVNSLNGLNLIDFPKKKSTHYRPLGKDGNLAQVHEVFVDKQNRYWLATTKGLMLFKREGIFPVADKILGSPDLTIFDIARIDDESLILTTSQAIYKWAPTSGSLEVVHAGGSPVVQKIGNHYWLESGGQLMVLDLPTKSIIKTFPKNGSDSLRAPLSPIKCIFQDSKQNIWIGTDGGGLSLYDEAADQFTHITTHTGLPNNVVYGVLEDGNRNLWISTNNGIAIFNLEKRSFIRHFNRNDGLQSNEFNTRVYFKSPSGKMYFGGVNGLSFFDPVQALNIPSFTPKTVLTAFFINNVRQEQDDNPRVSRLFSEQRIELSWNERNVGFEVAGIGFTFPSTVQYQYKLDNYDKEWNLMGNQNRITFTNLEAGDYLLRVRSGNAAGQWEPDGVALRITITSPFWKTWWFATTASLSTLFLAGFVYYQRVRYLKRRTLLLEKIVEERTREIQKQQEEIAAQNEELSAQADTLEKTNLELERRVESRTRRLKQLNEELVDQNTQLEQFAFITAHNIRGPVARMRGLLSLIQPGNLVEMLKHLQTSVTNLEEVITDLNTVLSLAQTVDKKFELISVKEEIGVVMNMLGNEIQSLQAKIDISEFEDVKIAGLKPYFQSILYNLFHNALKYSDHSRGAHIRCFTQQTTERIIIIVEDNGIGIDMRYAKDKIFKLHQRFHSHATGRGIGLYLVKTQVKIMHGKIEVASEVNVGTRFTLDFPKPN